ncbi:tRNA guanosine(34) transglycosylase Tgt [Chloroflexota bacterium]
MSKLNNFQLIHSYHQSQARAGILTTSHGTVHTPVFLPVGSHGAVKTLTPEDLNGIDITMLLANTYHLYLRPGISIIEKMGGLHHFMAWDGAILTDSGGYQIFSLAPLCQINDDGVIFRSHIDGSQHLITPELAIQFQESMGSDIIMVLDECPAHNDNLKKVMTAMLRTHQWAERCQAAQKRGDQALYAIVQGGLHTELRQQSAKHLTSLDFSGYAIGGLCLGEPKNKTLAIIEETVPLLPVDKPRYLMGIGSPEDIIKGIDMGVDIFDSALPTRVARNGAFFTMHGRINIRNAYYKQVERSIDPHCHCYTCSTYSAAYLHHLFNCNELLAYRLATIHNLSFINKLMYEIRVAIINNTFSLFKDSFLASYKSTNERVRLIQKQKFLNSRSFRLNSNNH